jgi:hypothetical protein
MATRAPAEGAPAEGGTLNGKWISPTVKDYGTLLELTAAIDFRGPEDGASKLAGPHHS